MKAALPISLAFVCLTSLRAAADDWPQWGGTQGRNMVSHEKGLPDAFQPGVAEKSTSATEPIDGANIKWVARLGVRTHGSPTVAQGKVFIGTNSFECRDGRKAPHGDAAAGRLACFDEQTGNLLWELVVPRLAERRAPHSDNGYGICSSATVEGDRVYIVTNRADVLCLDIAGLANGNDGPFQDEADYLAGADDFDKPPPPAQLKPTDADIIWRYDMFKELEVHPHDASSCSVLVHGELLYVCTGNGINGGENKVVSPLAPSLIALDKKTGRLVAKDDEKIGTRLFKGQWSSPSLCKAGGRNLIIFGGGDGACYAFEPATPSPDGQVATLKKVWEVDCIPPECRLPDGKLRPYRVGDNGPSEIVGTPVCADGRIYVTTGRDPNRGAGRGHLVRIDPAKGAVVWTYKSIGRSMSTAAVCDGLVYVGETFGAVHCVDAKTGEGCWTHEINGHIWGSCLAADGKVYVPTSRALLVFAADKEKKLLRSIKIGSGCYSTPCAANGVLYVASQKFLYAASAGKGDISKSTR